MFFKIYISQWTFLILIANHIKSGVGLLKEIFYKIKSIYYVPGVGFKAMLGISPGYYIKYE